MNARWRFHTVDGILPVALLGITAFAPGVYAVAAWALLVLHLLTLPLDMAPGRRLALLVGTMAIMPVCAEAAGVGLAAALTILVAFPATARVMRSLTDPADAACMERLRVEILHARADGMSAASGLRTSTRLFRTLLVSGAIIIVLGLVTGRSVLIASGGVWEASLVAAAGMIMVRLPRSFVAAEETPLRGLAGSRLAFTATLTPRSALPCTLWLDGLAPWVKVEPGTMIFHEPVSAHVRLTPPLSGPSKLRLYAAAVDPWGLTLTSQIVDVANVEIMPRAKYAAWLAERYLERTRAGTTAAAVLAVDSRRGRRGGADYAGPRPYEPGDALRRIDWKRTFKYNRFVVKEFRTTGAEAAILLIALEASDDDAVDRLMYDLVTTVLSLAHEGIPMVLAGYTSKDATEVSPLLGPHGAVLRALALGRECVRRRPPRRVLAPPRFSQLRRLYARLGQTETERPLRRLLGFEMDVLRAHITRHPAMRVTHRALRQCPPPAAIVCLSAGEEDTAVLGFALEQAAALGYRAVSLRN